MENTVVELHVAGGTNAATGKSLKILANESFLLIFWVNTIFSVNMSFAKGLMFADGTIMGAGMTVSVKPLVASFASSVDVSTGGAIN